MAPPTNTNSVPANVDDFNTALNASKLVGTNSTQNIAEFNKKSKSTMFWGIATGAVLGSVAAYHKRQALTEIGTSVVGHTRAFIANLMARTGRAAQTGIKAAWTTSKPALQTVVRDTVMNPKFYAGIGKGVALEMASASQIDETGTEDKTLAIAKRWNQQEYDRVSRGALALPIPGIRNLGNEYSAATPIWKELSDKMAKASNLVPKKKSGGELLGPRFEPLDIDDTYNNIKIDLPKTKPRIL